MKTAPLPPNEKERLAALHALLILDTPPEQRFDRITEFAASEFDAPIALISLVDENRQWLKSRVGLDVCETSRDVAFCAHALLSTEPLVVPDTLKDERFADNPLVVGMPHIRFYTGAPLVLPSGLIAGTLCIIDTKPREVDATDLAILGTLRDLAVSELLERGQA
ncbi:MAG TPA: GAF domain-containing protein [Roseateles sp.]|jgi:GAF domain-containing protein|nr:GAF domain-containing protein [Roseateles sp.]HWT54878.1 GAF domain-containing protein [Rhodocyclaceae bacterium]